MCIVHQIDLTNKNVGDVHSAHRYSSTHGLVSTQIGKLDDGCRQVADDCPLMDQLYRLPYHRPSAECNTWRYYTILLYYGRRFIVEISAPRRRRKHVIRGRCTQRLDT